MCALASACLPPTEQSVAYKIPSVHTKRKVYQCRRDNFIGKLWNSLGFANRKKGSMVCQRWESVPNVYKLILTSSPIVTLDCINCHFIRFSFQHPEGLASLSLWIGWVSNSLLIPSSFSVWSSLGRLLFPLVKFTAFLHISIKTVPSAHYPHNPHLHTSPIRKWSCSYAGTCLGWVAGTRRRLGFQLGVLSLDQSYIWFPAQFDSTSRGMD